MSELDDLQAYRDELQANRPNLEGRRLRDTERQITELELDIKRLQAEASNVSIGKRTGRASTPVTGRMEISGQGQVHGAAILTNLGHVWINQTFTTITASGRSAEYLLYKYAISLKQNANKVALGTDSSVAEGEMKLSNLFTMLNVEAQRPAKPDGADRESMLERSITLTVLAALNEDRYRHMVLLGEPGAGKSTVVGFLAAALAAQSVGDDDAYLLTHTGWSHPPLLPVRVRLQGVVPAADPDQQTYEDLWQAVNELNCTDPEEQIKLRAAVEELLKAGKGFLLLDGLDEVPPERLAAVKGCMLHACAAFPKSRVLVSCRVYDYQNAPDSYPSRQLAGWPTVRLLPFDAPTQLHYIANWYSELGRQRASNDSPLEIKTRHDHLAHALQTHATLRRLAGSPLLLALMANINTEHAPLPETEGLLYFKCVDELLKRRPSKETVQVSVDDLHDLVTRLAFAAHQLEAVEGASYNGLRESVIEEQIKHYYQQRYPRLEQRHMVGSMAGAALLRLLRSNGLFQEQSNLDPENRHYGFAHRMFQQFLAGKYLQTNQGRKYCFDLATDDHWRISLHLMANYAPHNNAIDRVLMVAQKLLAGLPAEQMVGAELLAHLGEKYVVGEGCEHLWATAVERMQVLSGIRPDRADPALPSETQRLRAGLALGELGDPRLFRADGTLIPITQRLVPLAAGTFHLENDDGEQRTIDLPAFAMGRYLVTNAEYRQFMEHGGYRDERWWQTEEARRWRRGDPAFVAALHAFAKERYNWNDQQASLVVNPRTTPYFWDDERFNGPTQPVVGLNWWEANAYCAWLTARHPGHSFRLPSDFEWERAARNGDGREYPWGADWRAGYANTEESTLNQTTPVGLYPQGAWPEGPLDLSGNVWEWTASAYVPYTSEDDHKRIDITYRTDVSIRGGSWGGHPQYVRCACRVNLYPFIRNFTLGLRVVAASQMAANQHY